MAFAEKLPSGKYRGVYRDQTGRKVGVGTHTSKREILRVAREAEGKAFKGLTAPVDAGRMTFSTYFEDEWMPNRVAEQTTLADYRSNYRKHYKPTFGAVELRKIDGPILQRWISAQVKAGAKPSSIEKRVRQMQTILAGQKGVSALRDGRIAINPCKGLSIPPRARATVAVYSMDQLDQLMRHIGDWWIPLCAVAADLGWRWGELQGLEVRDIGVDLRVHLNRTIIALPMTETGLPTPFQVKDYPKENRARAARLSPPVARMLASMIDERSLGANDRLFAMPDWDSTPGLVWTDGTAANQAPERPLRTEDWPNGQPVANSHFRNRVWLPGHRRAGLTEVHKFHALRASLISWLLAGGADVTSVMNRVGHTQLATTQKYVNALQSADDRALDALERARGMQTGAQLVRT